MTRLTNLVTLIGWSFLMVANYRMLQWLIRLSDYQQAALAAMDCPQSPRIADRKAELDREALRLEMAMRFN